MNPKTHYKVGDKELPRVTHILNIISKGKGYEEWLKKLTKEESEKISEESLAIGGNWHNWLEGIGLGKPPDTALLSETEKKWAEQFLMWKDTNIKAFLETETMVYTDKYCGTLDSLVFLRDHKIALVDYKTSNSIYPSMYLQLAAYRHAYQEMHEIPIDTAFILRFDKKSGKMEVKEVPEIAYQYEMFTKALDLFNWNNNKGERNAVS